MSNRTQTRDVLIPLDGSELPQCQECCAPIKWLHSRYRWNRSYYYLRARLECEAGHTRVLVASPQPLTPEMKELLS